MGKTPKSKEDHRFRSAFAGASMAILVGLVAWYAPVGGGLIRLSYDLQFVFGRTTPTNQVVVVVMDGAAHHNLGQTYGQWQRSLHARFLRNLDQAKLVVFDIFFADKTTPEEDQVLENALRDHAQHGRVVIAGDYSRESQSRIIGATILPPYEPFARAVGDQHWGVPSLTKDADGAIRQHSPEPHQHSSLFRLTANLLTPTNSTAPPPPDDQARWIRYYGPFEPGQSPFERLSYHLALDQSPDYFRNKIVFIGGYPTTRFVGDDPDEFRVPYTRWDGHSASGVEIVATIVLNLLRGDWIERLSPSTELLVLTLTGLFLGGGLVLLRPGWALGLAASAFVLITFIGVSLPWHSTTWFPWMIIAGAQLPVALVWSVVANSRRVLLEKQALETQLEHHPAQANQTTALDSTQPNPSAPLAIPDYQLLRWIGQGAYGEVWLVQDRINQYRAAKIVYQNRLPNVDVYEREFRGIANYVPLSLSHPALLHVVHVGRQDAAGYYYCVMEAADDETHGEQIIADRYQPRDLAKDLSKHLRLPIRDCAQLAWHLTAGLGYLHDNGLIHRDIKPANIVFVQGQPKLADIGLVSRFDLTTLAPPSQVGTLAYLPPEGPTSPAADIFALGKVLYQASTGLGPQRFPELPTDLPDLSARVGFAAWNQILLKACHRNPAHRYPTAHELHAALEAFLHQFPRP